MKDQDGRTVKKGDCYRWEGNGRIYEVVQVGKRLVFYDKATGQPSALKINRRNLDQMTLENGDE